MIQEHLNNLATITSGIQSEYYSWLSENGKSYSERIDCEIPDYVKIKGCYGNAIKHSLYEDTDYLEGFYVTDGFGFPFEHAFNMKDGELIDITSAFMGFDVTEWFGIKLSTAVVMEYALSNCPEYVMPLQYYFMTRIKNRKEWI